MGRRKEPTEAELLEQQRKEIKDALDVGKTELDLNTQSMDVLQELCAVTTLTKLTLHTGSLKTLPKEIGKLVNLEGLHINGNQLESLPDEIGALTKLDTFYAYSNKFKELPETFGDLANLRKLVLWSNELTTVPKSFGKLARLDECELKWNKLSKLPDTFGNLSSVTELDLQSNELETLPADLSGMKKLRRLKLGKNKLSKFPMGLLTLPAIVEIDLSENGLTALPDDIDRLKATLRELRVDENELTSLPKKLYSIPLVALKLDTNKLAEFPKELASMKTLIELVIRDNPCIPDDASWRSKDEIFHALGLTQPRTVSDKVPEKGKERDAILAKYKTRLENFARECKRDPKTPAVLAFVKGEGNNVPPSALRDSEDMWKIVEVFAPYPEWTFVDRRILAFITQDAWRYKNPGYDYFRGFDDHVYRWVKEQMESEPAGSTLFGDLAKEIVAYGVSEQTLVAGAVTEMHENLVRGDGQPTSLGTYLVQRAKELEGFFAEQKGYAQEALVGLLLRHAKDTFLRIGHKLLVLEANEHGNIHVPYDALDQACPVDPARFEPFIFEALEKTNCSGCRADTARVLAKYYPQHKAKALEIAKKTFVEITEGKNKEERYSFAFGGSGWDDGTAKFVSWALATFGKDIHAEVKKHVEDTKAFDLDVAEAVAKALGQESVEIVAEGLKMEFDDASIAEHFERMFAMLAPLDWSKYHDKAWELARSEFAEVRETACEALGKLDAKLVVPKAKELLDAKKGHEREAGVMILSGVNDKECRKILEGLLDTEKSDDARDIIVLSYYEKPEKIDRDEAERRVKSADGRGKLDKPVVKWIDEKKLPPLYWGKTKNKLDADTVRFLFHRQSRQGDISFDEEVRDIIPLIDRDRSGPFAEKLLGLVMKNGGPSAKTRLALPLVGALGNDDLVEALEEVAIEGKNENAVRTIGMIGSMGAARSLDRIIKVFRTKYPNVREPAQEAFQEIAESMGMTPFELADSMIPDFGFQKGRLELKGAKPPVFATIGPDQKVAFVDKAGEPMKPPKALGPKPKAQLEELRDSLKESVRQLKTSLEYYLIVRRRWDPKAWSAFFEKNPLAISFAGGFVWAAYADDGKPKMLFRMADGEKVDADGKKVTLPSGTIGLVHPLEIAPAVRTLWVTALKTAGVTAAFAQLERPTFLVAEDERARAKCFRFEEKELSGLTFKGRAERLGWRRGSVIDGGGVSAYRKLFPHDKIEVFIQTDGLSVSSGWEDDSEVTLKDLFFVRPGAIVTGSYTYDEPRDETDERLVKLADVPPIVFSETIADLTAITKSKDDAEA